MTKGEKVSATRRANIERQTSLSESLELHSAAAKLGGCAMTTAQMKRKMAGIERRLARIFEDATAMVDDTPDEETGHQLQEVLGGVGLATNAASAFVTHLTKGAWQ